MRVGDEAHVARHDDTLAGQRADGDHAMVIHLGDFLVIRIEPGEPRHVADGAVRVMRLHEQPLCRAFSVTALFRKNRDAPERWLVGERVSHSLAQPPREKLVRLRTALEAQPALMWQRGRRLLDDEAFVRCSGENAATAVLLDDLGVVGPGVIREHGKLESILPLGLGMTRARVAPGLAQRREHVA